MNELNVHHDCDHVGCGEKNLRHCCAERGCYMDTLWDWGPYNECFGDTRIKISDIDGFVERNGKFLILDGKRISPDGGCYIEPGQLTAYRKLAQFGVHVIVFHGEPPHDVQFVRQWLPYGEFIDKEACDAALLRTLISEWFAMANRDAA